MNRKMKDSGVEWIGEIPEGWEIIRNKRVMRREKEICQSWQGEPVLSLTLNGIIERDLDNPSGKMPTTFDGYQYIRQGGLLLCLFDIDVTPRCVGLILQDGVTSPAYSHFRLQEGYHAPYYYYYYLMLDYSKELLHLAKNIRHSFTESQLGEISVIAPSYEEQQRIADFLDAQTAEIDASIAKTQESIEEYKKLKQAVITQAVTKGIRPGRVMKDSGVEWIGEIPAEWALMKLKYCTRILRGGSPRPIEDFISADGNGYNWIKIGDTTKGCKYISSAKSKIIESGLPKTRFVHEGDLILTNSMSFGEPYILKINGCIHDGWVALTQLQKIDKEFLYYLLSSDICNTQFKLAVDGGVVQNLNIEKIGAALIVIPSIQEQQEIAAYLDEKCAAIDTLIEKKQAIITELEAYKKALIYEYVTGKKEVPVAT